MRNDLTKHELRTLISDVVKDQVTQAVADVAKQPAHSWAPQVLSAERTDKMVDGKTLGAAQLIRALAAGNCQQAACVDWASKAYGANSPVSKALQSNIFDGGGATVRGDFATEIIELLRPRSVVRAMNPRKITPDSGTHTFPKLTAGATANYVGEGQDIPKSQPTTGQIIADAKKLTCLVPVNNNLLQFTNQSADEWIRDDMIETIATKEDSTFLRSDGFQNTPTGLRYLAVSSNITSSNGTTAAQIEQDFVDLMNSLETNDVPLRRCHWLMNPRSKNHLFNLRDANGNLIYPSVQNPSPTLYGWPILPTNNIPINLGGGTETEIYLVEATEVMLYDFEEIRIETFRQGTYTSGGSLISAVERDETIIRAVIQHDLKLRHNVAVALKSDVVWGA